MQMPFSRAATAESQGTCTGALWEILATPYKQTLPTEILDYLKKNLKNKLRN